jgi:hypothetical protein
MAYGVSESQLRGEMPVDGINIPEEPKELKDILPPDEYEHLWLCCKKRDKPENYACDLIDYVL